ncbi:hypothetical protein B0A48_14020 [Cryoendolithus antarcticus]|uniref:Ion transport domain-containing protein n=1 Tax=Cryoendolithus antarcticus TaxID=1507870 RepID=A0A1V8SM78_9PEZI|nr:hypothetical protein B0A48_14020 [Cryoendolithus antarcticus]
MLGMWKRSKSDQRDNQEDDSDQLSPFAGSPEVTRSRVVGGKHQNAEEELNTRGRGRGGYFHTNHREEVGEDADEGADEDDEDDDDDEEDGDEDDGHTPLLPIFSAAHLDRLPLYNITHAIRLLIVQRAETTLSWEQLRSPQISQFLVKPIQEQIRTNQFNRATLCALIANCLQFQKEGQLQPGNVGVSKTRALISELLAMRLVKEFTTRELIDALSYDFDPLQGMTTAVAVGTVPGNYTPTMRDDAQAQRVRGRGARVSTIEIAIRAQAKRFLAHPLIVQHLEAIWAGSIVFHSEADNLHRKPVREKGERRGRTRELGYGTTDLHSPSALPADAVLSRKSHATRATKKPEVQHGRRSVTLYDPHDASLFKLSRLRVPRYRQLFSTISFATMLCLYIAVLYDRSLMITPLEIVFWFWSIGYMLDEVIGFTEQGFGLYILSFWNAFDLGILLLFVVYYVLRLYGILLAESGRRQIANMAYDALASTAILLFPRLFSVLDHYRYFSQLLIAFRMMAQDLVAILVLILISTSGFFVAFTLSFSDERSDSNDVAYALFQILMGFTPAAWDRWSSYNILGKAIMASFLIICHFLIVTILITVLTNSFMAIVRNAEEEHQYLFAINTISMVKSDALFSYVAPTNVFAWLLSPLRYIMPFRRFVKLNRTIIKITHFPVLFIIFVYERMILGNLAFEPTDLVTKPVRSQKKPVAFSLNKVPELFSPGVRLREPSVISLHKDRALEEVFRRPFNGSTMRTTDKDMDPDRRNSVTVVDRWMQGADDEGGASPPLEQPRSVLERLENRKPRFRRAHTGGVRSGLGRDGSLATQSMVSEPDMLSFTAPTRPKRIDEEEENPGESIETLPLDTEADGDDESDAEHATRNLGESAVSVREKENRTPAEDSDSEYFHTPIAARSPLPTLSSAARARLQGYPELESSATTQLQTVNAKRGAHSRNQSSATVMFAPKQITDGSLATRPITRLSRPATSKRPSSGDTAIPVFAPHMAPSGTRTPKPKPTRARPIMPPRQQTAPMAVGGLSFLDTARQHPRIPSFNARALDLASEIGDNKFVSSGNMMDPGAFDNMPASFSEQFLRSRDLERMREEERRRSEAEEKGMVNRIMLARMNTLEEGFKDILKEIKGISSQRESKNGSSRQQSEVEFAMGGGPKMHVLRPRQQVEGKAKSPKKLRSGVREKGKNREGERPGSGLRDSGSFEAESPISVVPAEQRTVAEGDVKGEVAGGTEGGAAELESAKKED